MKLSIPYSPYASKNRKFQWKSAKHRHPEYAAFVANVDMLVRNQMALKGISFVPKTKVYVDLVLVKTPKMTKTDAANFLEAICDGVKLAIGIDDSYYAGSFDWQMGDEAMFLLELTQSPQRAATALKPRRTR